MQVMPIAVAFGTSVVFIEVSRRVLLRRAVMDLPSERSSHDTPVVRGVGAGVALALGLGLLVLDLSGIRGAAGLAIACMGFAAIGCVEDLWRDRSVVVRFAAQAVVAFVAAAVATLDGSDGEGALVTGAALLLVVGWLLVGANFANFMDGINGISAFTAVSFCGSLALIVSAGDGPGALASASLLVGGAFLAFVPFNVPVARAFLGDSGSYLLGAAIAALVVLAVRAGVPVVAAVAPAVPYFGDAAVTLAKRIARGERWWEPHREHTYQRLVSEHGWGHVASAGAMAAATLAAGASGLVAVQLDRTWMAAVGAALALTAHETLPFVSGRRRRSIAAS